MTAAPSPTGAALRRALLTQVVLQTSGYTVMRPMASYRAIELGADGTALGLLAASFALLPLLLAFTVGRAIDHRGPVLFLTLGTVVVLAAGLVSAVVDSLAMLFVATTAVGLGQLFCMLSQQSMAALDTSTSRDRSFGLLTSAAALGQIVGPSAGAFVADHWLAPGMTEAMVGLVVGCVLTASALVPLMALRRGHGRSPDAARRARGSSRRVAVQLIRTPGMWQALFAGGVVLACLDLLAAFLPLWATERDISISTVGLLLSTRALVTMLSRIGSDRLVARLGRRRLLIASLVAGVVGLVILPFVDLVGAASMMVVLGVGLGLAQPLTMSWVADMAAPGTSGTALGMRLTVNRLGQAAIPAVIAAVAAGSGAAGVFLVSALVMGAAAGTLAASSSSADH